MIKSEALEEKVNGLIVTTKC